MFLLTRTILHVTTHFCNVCSHCSAQALREECDVAVSNQIDEDEFLRVWNMVNVPRRRIRGTKDYAKRTRAEGYTNRDIGADAARALKKIALGPTTDPTKYVTSFAGMPKHFRQSCLAPLDEDDRFTTSSVLSGVAD